VKQDLTLLALQHFYKKHKSSSLDYENKWKL
jgi:hypothetical protein